MQGATNPCRLHNSSRVSLVCCADRGPHTPFRWYQRAKGGAHLLGDVTTHPRVHPFPVQRCSVPGDLFSAAAHSSSATFAPRLRFRYRMHRIFTVVVVVVVVVVVDSSIRKPYRAGIILPPFVCRRAVLCSIPLVASLMNPHSTPTDTVGRRQMRTVTITRPHHHHHPHHHLLIVIVPSTAAAYTMRCVAMGTTMCSARVHILAFLLLPALSIHFQIVTRDGRCSNSFDAIRAPPPGPGAKGGRVDSSGFASNYPSLAL